MRVALDAMESCTSNLDFLGFAMVRTGRVLRDQVERIYREYRLRFNSKKHDSGTEFQESGCVDSFVMKCCWQSLTRDLYALQTSRRLEHAGAIVVPCSGLPADKIRAVLACCFVADVAVILCNIAESTDIVLLACLASPEKKRKTVYLDQIRSMCRSVTLRLLLVHYQHGHDVGPWDVKTRSGKKKQQKRIKVH